MCDLLLHTALNMLTFIHTCHGKTRTVDFQKLGEHVPQVLKFVLNLIYVDLNYNDQRESCQRWGIKM